MNSINLFYISSLFYSPVLLLQDPAGADLAGAAGGVHSSLMPSPISRSEDEGGDAETAHPLLGKM